jgi:hypothetical protein
MLQLLLVLVQMQVIHLTMQLFIQVNTIPLSPTLRKVRESSLGSSLRLRYLQTANGMSITQPCLPEVILETEMLLYLPLPISLTTVQQRVA